MVFSRKYPWRQILALFCAFLVCTALCAQARQAALADKLVRLHVLANSDTPSDQALKLQVRDAVLRQARPLLAGARSGPEAAEHLRRQLARLTQAAQDEVWRQGYDYPVAVTLEDVWFPTRRYGAAALPAGTYHALRVVVGAGAGHNWWCVVFPSLCLPAVSESALETAGLSPSEVALITERSPSCVFRFKTVEWWETLKHKLS